MVGHLAAVTAAPVGKSAPSSGDSSRVSGGYAGKRASAGGEDLPAAPAAPAAEALAAAVSKLNHRLAEAQRQLSFRIDESSGRTVITVVDAATNEVVRQIPSEEVLALARAAGPTGPLVDVRA
jgi:flagellar protein FlaG